MNYNQFDGPFVDLSRKRIASDGQTIVPVKYTFANTPHFGRFGWYILDSLRKDNIPQLHNPDGICYVRWTLAQRRVMCGELEIPIFRSELDSIEYYSDGLLHRKEGPSIIKKDSNAWYKHGVIHRLNDYAYVLKLNNTTYYNWRVDGLLHRINGPAKSEAIRRFNINHASKVKHKNIWYFMGERIPKNIIRFAEGKPTQPLDKHAIMEASLFNRGYGSILNIIYSMNRIPSEAEIYKLITGRDW